MEQRDEGARPRRSTRARVLVFGSVLLVAWVPGLVALAMLLSGNAG